MTVSSSLTLTIVVRIISKLFFVSACKRKDVMEAAEQPSAPKKPRLVFTDLQRRTLQAIFKVQHLANTFVSRAHISVSSKHFHITIHLI